MHSLELTTYLWMTASALWGALVLWWVRKGLALSAPGEPLIRRQKVFNTNLQILMALVIISGVAFSTPEFSDDVIRYVWDGWVTIHGQDPYALAPNAPELAGLRVTEGDLTLPDQVPFDELNTVYPPGAQMVFALMAWLAGIDVEIWSILWLVLAAVLITPIHWFRPEDGHFMVWIGLLFLSPTVLLFGFGEVHLDILVGITMLGGLMAARKGHYLAAGFLLGLGATIKYLPLIPLAYLALYYASNRNQRVQLLGSAAAVIAMICLPWIGSALLGNLPNFVANWRSNAGLYEVVRSLLPHAAARWMMFGMGLATMVLVWRRWRRDPGVATALTLMTALLMSPVVHAWYLLPVAFLLPLAPLRSTLVWLATVSVYGLWVTAYQTTGVWTETPALLAVEYVPVWIAFGMDLRNGPLDQRFRLKMV